VDIVALFYDLDKFAVGFEPALRRHLLADGKPHRDRPGRMHLSEVMTILVLFHDSGYRTFKHFYQRHVNVHLRAEFPRLVSYGRFVERVPHALLALGCFLRTRLGRRTGIGFVDSTALRVCHNARIDGHRVMKGLAARGRTSTGWFYGFKLHLVVSDRGELLGLCFTPGNVDDRKPVDGLTADLSGRLVGDKGYISQDLFRRLFARGLRLVTRIKANMKNQLMPVFDKLLLRKRAIVESVIDRLKNGCQAEHSRHRSPANYFADVLAGLVAYTYADKLPSLNLRPAELQLLDRAAA
jgi:hypothetical protein